MSAKDEENNLLTFFAVIGFISIIIVGIYVGLQVVSDASSYCFTLAIRYDIRNDTQEAFCKSHNAKYGEGGYDECFRYCVSVENDTIYRRCIEFQGRITEGNFDEIYFTGELAK